MADSGHRWHRLLFYRAESIKSTWLLRGLLLAPIALLVLTRALWLPAVGESLVCREDTNESPAILVDNLDPDYLTFERARQLHDANVTARVLVPLAAGEAGVPNAISKGTAELMARVARLPDVELLPIVEKEPITLNAARQLGEFLIRERLSAVTVVVPGFRSRRSYLAYMSALAPAGISVRCVPVFGTRTPSNWTDTWHGIQEVGLQFLKLQYYRFWVLL